MTPNSHTAPNKALSIKLSQAGFIVALFFLPYSLGYPLMSNLSITTIALVCSLCYLPLWLLSYGIFKAQHRSFILLCFLLLFYFAVDITRLANGLNGLAIASVILETLLFTSGLLAAKKVQ